MKTVPPTAGLVACNVGLRVEGLWLESVEMLGMQVQGLQFRSWS